MNQIETIMKSGENSVLEKLHKYFTCPQYVKSQIQNQKITERVKMPQIFPA